MKKYTLKTIKQTTCYKANIEAIKAIYPNQWKLFAQELMIAMNSKGFVRDSVSVCRSFVWHSTPQEEHAWCEIYIQILKYEEKA